MIHPMSPLTIAITSISVGLIVFFLLLWLHERKRAQKLERAYEKLYTDALMSALMAPQRRRRYIKRLIDEHTAELEKGNTHGAAKLAGMRCDLNKEAGR